MYLCYISSCEIWFIVSFWQALIELVPWSNLFPIPLNLVWTAEQINLPSVSSSKPTTKDMTVAFESLFPFKSIWLEYMKASLFLFCTYLPLPAVILYVPVICRCSDLKQPPLYRCLQMMAQKFGQGTAGWLVSALWMFRVSAGKMWMAAGDSKSWEPESSGGFFTHTPGTWAKLEPSREQWHVAYPHGSGFSQHGTGSKKKHLERALRENQRRSCLVFTDLVSHVTKHLSLCWLKQLPACPDVRKEAPAPHLSVE